MFDHLVVLRKSAARKYTNIMRGDDLVPYIKAVNLKYNLGDGTVLDANIEVTDGVEMSHQWIAAQCRDLMLKNPSLVVKGRTVEGCITLVRQTIESVAYS